MNKVGRIVSYIASVAAILSIALSIYIRSRYLDGVERPYQLLAYIILTGWILLPPIWFWVEWVFFTAQEIQDHRKHTHTLARNIWLALIVVLMVILDIKLIS